LEKEGISLCDIAKMSFEGNDLIGMDQRRKLREFLNSLGERLCVRVIGRLLDGL
jgi:hypothetical protein